MRDITDVGPPVLPHSPTRRRRGSPGGSRCWHPHPYAQRGWFSRSRSPPRPSSSAACRHLTSGTRRRLPPSPARGHLPQHRPLERLAARPARRVRSRPRPSPSPSTTCGPPMPTRPGNGTSSSLLTAPSCSPRRGCPWREREGRRHRRAYPRSSRTRPTPSWASRAARERARGSWNRSYAGATPSPRPTSVARERRAVASSWEDLSSRTTCPHRRVPRP